MRIQDSALIAAATLSNRYIADRFLPDKAIDLIDESASKLRIEIDRCGGDRRGAAPRDAARDRAPSLVQETDDASKDRLAILDRELAEERERLSSMQASWQAEKDLIVDVSKAKEALENAHRVASRLERVADLQRAAELRYGRIPELEQQLARAEAGWPSTAGASSRRRSTHRTSPRSSAAGPASP